MSNEAITWAWRQEVAPGEKLVLLVLADYADEEWSCFPSQARISRMTGQGERTVRRLLDALEASGVVRREARYKDGHRTSDRFVLGEGIPLSEQPAKMAGTGVHTGQNGRLEPVHTGQNVQFIPAKLAGYPLEEPKEVQEMATPTELDPSTPARSAAPAKALDAEFPKFWAAYPRKVAKGAALRAYRAARRKVSLDALLAALDAYQKNKPDWQDYAYPASWLNAERWEDQWAAAAPRSTAPESRPVPNVDPDDVEAFIAAMTGGNR